MADKPNKKRIMRSLVIREISGVDVPAQEGAKALIMKRHDSPADSDKQGDDPVPDDKNQDAKDAAEEQAEKIKELEAKLAQSEKLAKLNDAERAHYETLEGDAQDEFLGKSADERGEILSEVAKATKDADPVVYKTLDGVELRKSAGDVLIAMAKSNDALRKRNDELIEKNEQIELHKRVDDELAHLPGTVEERAALLKAVDGIDDEAAKDAALNALKAGDKAIGAAFDSVGHRGGQIEKKSEEQTLEDLAKARQAKEPTLTFAQAYDAVLRTEEGKALYNKSVQ